MKFELGQVVMTRSIADWIAENEIHRTHMVRGLISRHAAGDWGDMCDDDKQANEDALQHGGRIFSSYTYAGIKIWIITENDRSATTVLFPDDY